MIPAGLGAYGPFFALSTADGPGWEEFPEDLAGRVAQTRAELERRSGHRVEHRVAASITHLGLAARLVAPALAVAGLTGSVPDLRPSNLRWRPQPGGAVPLAVVDDTLRPPDLRTYLLDTVDAIGAAMVGSQHIRDGNVASAIATAGRLCPPAEPFARALLQVHEPTSPVPQGFRRRSCCLYYRVDGRAGYCADCVLASRSFG